MTFFKYFLLICMIVSIEGYSDICYGDLGCFTDRPPFGGENC